MMNRFVSLVFFTTCCLFQFQAWTQCPGMNPVNLGPDTTLCPGQTLSLNAASTGPYSSYLWNNNATAPNKIITTAGTYWIKVTQLGPNLITNGDFEAGNTGFTTAYTLGTGGTWGLVSNPGTYAIVNSPNAAHVNFSVCNDHTAAPGTQQLVVNGSSTANTNVWCQTVNVTPGLDYQFGAWASNALNDPNVAQLQFSINSVNLGPIFSTSTIGCTWQQFFQTWNAGLNNTALICINNQNTAGGGNDFLLDDITFNPVCTDFDTITVNYSTNPVVNLGPDQTICSTDSIVLDAQNAGMTYQWLSGETSQTITVNTNGTFGVTVTNAAGCHSSDQITVSTETIQSAGLDSSAVYCETFGTVDLTDLLSPGTSIAGNWTDPSGSLSADLSSNGQLTVTNHSGSYTLSYVVNGTVCPNDTSNFNVKINSQPLAAFNSTHHLCNTNGVTVDLNTFVTGATPTLPPFWEEISTTTSNQFHANTGILDQSNLANGTFSFAFILPADSLCVSDTTFIAIEITEHPTVAFHVDRIKGCVPLDVIFTNESSTAPNSTFSWNLGDGTTSSSATVVNHTYTATGCFDATLSITADNLCTSTLTIPNIVCVDPLPVASFTYSPQQIYSVDPTVHFNNTSTNNFTNQWDFNDGNQSQEISPTHQFPLGDAENYTVELIVTTDQGCSDTTYQIIIVKDQLLYFVPNSFTPDGDEFNNTFQPVLTAGIDLNSYELYIFDRWGELVFETTDANESWDGTYKGSLLPSGTYVWKIQFKNEENDGKLSFTGHVNLLR